MRVTLLLCLFACSGGDDPVVDPDAMMDLEHVSNLEVSERRATELVLRWTPGTEDSGRYWLAYAKGEAAPVTCSPDPSLLDVNGRETVVSGLDAKTTYAFRLCPVDERSGSLTIDPGITATGKTLELPPGELSGLTVTQSGPGTFDVSWQSASGAAAYVVAYAEGPIAPSNCFATNVVQTAATFTQLTGLPTNKTYAVRVCAKNGNPTPDLSAGLTKLAFMHSPLAANPASVSAAALDAEWMRLVWTAGAGEYKVAIGTQLPADSCTTATETSKRPSLVLTNLAPSTQYQIRVCPSNGDSQPLYSTGSVFVVTTPARKEPRVNGLTCTQGGSLTLRWSGSGPASAYRFTKVLTSSGMFAPQCTVSNSQFLQTSGTPASFSSSVFGGFANERYFLRVCFQNPNGTFDQGQMTSVIMPQTSGGVFINGSCSQQETIVRPTMTIAAMTAIVRDRVTLSGNCSIAGAGIAIGGDASGGATCGSDLKWSAIANVTTIGDGPIRIAASAFNQSVFQSPAVFVTVTKMCESTTTMCGNGVMDAGEECDLGCGNANDHACTPACKVNVCGDGLLGPGEQCDQGMQNSNTGACTLACQNQVCGNGYVGPNEQCDDGANNSSSGACTPVCTTQRCGDGYLGTMEQCDSGDAGNHSISGTCTPECKPQICGDGYRGAGEECDAGATNADTNVCKPGCLLNRCGDGFKSPLETCDDGNTVGGDACAANCGVDANTLGARIAAGFAHNCGVRTDGTIVCAGYPEYFEGTPSGVFTAVNARGGYTCGLRPNGSEVCWGKHLGLPSAPTPPATLFKQIDGDCGLRFDGTIECFGGSMSTPGVFQHFRVGNSGSNGGGCGLRDDQTIACWGQTYQPPANAGTAFRQVTVEAGLPCGLRLDGSFACWSDMIYIDRPGPYVQIAGGYGHACGRTATGVVECFGSNSVGQATPPAGTFMTIDASGEHTCGMLVDGTMRCWGSYNSTPAGVFLP